MLHILLMDHLIYIISKISGPLTILKDVIKILEPNIEEISIFGYEIDKFNLVIL